MNTYLCLDIGGTSVKYGIYQEQNGFLTDGSFPTQAWLGGPSIITRVLDQCRILIKRYPNICGICISTAGMVNCDTGSITYASSLIPEYTGTPLKDIFEKEFSLPTEVENDVNCAGLAEYHSGAAKGCSSCLCLTIGTGIGGSFILNGSVFRGYHGSACEVGYMHLPDGAFQDLASTSALVKSISLKKGIPASHLTGKAIFDMAKAGDPDCITGIETMVAYLGMGIANICYVLNPEMVVLGGGIMVQKDYLYDKIRASLDNYLLPSVAQHTRLHFAQNENRAGMIGAYYHFRFRKKR